MTDIGTTVNYSDQIKPGTDLTELGKPEHVMSVPAEGPLDTLVGDLEGEEDGMETESRSKLGAILYEVVETIILAVIIWLAVNVTTARYVVEGHSMEPNLHTGQFLIVSRLAFMQFGDWLSIGEPQRGDIIVFDYPGNPTDDYVKRIIGLPGDTVSISEDGRVVVNGRELVEPYLSTMGGVPYRGRTGTWTVSEGEYFVLGDNRNSSSDSRSWGNLNADYVVGQAWVSYWPPKYWSVIPHYTYE